VDRGSTAPHISEYGGRGRFEPFKDVKPIPVTRLPGGSPTEFSMLPGGYDFIHVIFWTFVAMIIVGTNFMAIALSAGLGILLMEAIGKK
jgi:hypothetical protein